MFPRFLSIFIILTYCLGIPLQAALEYCMIFDYTVKSLNTRTTIVVKMVIVQSCSLGRIRNYLKEKIHEIKVSEWNGVRIVRMS